jgi:hypothetical protein
MRVWIMFLDHVFNTCLDNVFFARSLSKVRSSVLTFLKSGHPDSKKVSRSQKRTPVSKILLGKGPNLSTSMYPHHARIHAPADLLKIGSFESEMNICGRDRSRQSVDCQHININRLHV